MSKTIITSIGFQAPNGSLIASGTLTLDLSQDAELTTGGGQVSTRRIVINLDANAKIPAGTTILANDELTPNGTFYNARVFDSNGNLAFGPEKWVIQGTSPINLSLLTPAAALTVSVTDVGFLATSNTWTGSNTWTSSNTHSGTETFSGLVQCKNFENVQCVDSTLSRGGVDVGDEINKAYAALPYVSTGTGRIDVYPPATNSCYSFSTAINLNTNNKPVVVDFHGTCLTWTGSTSATVLTLDTGLSNTIVSSALVNGHLTNGVAAGTTVGMALGVTSGNSCQFCETNMEVDGFQTGVTVAGKGVQARQMKVIGPSTSGSVCLSLASGADVFTMFGGVLAQCNTLFTETAAVPATFIGVNFTEAKGGALGTNTYISQTFSERLSFVNCKFAAIIIRPLFWNQTTGRMLHVNSIFEDDLISGSPTSYATTSGGVVEMIGGDLSSFGESVTEFVLLSGSAQAYFSGVSNFNPALIPSLWNTTYAGGQVTETGTMTNGFSNVDYFNYRTLSLNASTCASGGVNTGKLCHDTNTNRLSMNNNNSGLLTITGNIASGTATMTTAAIASGACGTTVTVAATGVTTTDAIAWSFNAAPAANPGELVVSSWPTANNVNLQYCNPTAGSVTPTAATLNWRVVR